MFEIGTTTNKYFIYIRINKFSINVRKQHKESIKMFQSSTDQPIKEWAWQVLMCLLLLSYPPQCLMVDPSVQI